MAKEDTKLEVRYGPTALGLLVACLIFAVGAIVVLYVSYEARNTEVANTRTNLESLARLAAAQIDGDKHPQLRSPQQEGTFIHELLIEPMVDFHNASPLVYRLYTFIPRPDGGYFIVLDTTQELDQLMRIKPDRKSVQIMEAYDPRYSPEDMRAIQDLWTVGDAYATKTPYTDRFGTFMSGFSPVMDADGQRVAIAGVDMTNEMYEERMGRVRGVAIGGVLLLLILSLLMGLLASWIRRILMKAEDVKNRARRRSLQSLEELEYNQKLLKSIAEMNRVILSESQLKVAINRALQIVGQAAGVDRVYLMEHSVEAETGDTLATQRYEWARPGIAPHIDDPMFKSLSFRRLGFSHWYERFREGKEVLGFVRDMSSAEAAFLRSFEVSSIFCCPILFDQSCWGYMALEDCHRERHWTEEQRAIIAASARNLGAAIKRNQEEVARQVADQRFRAIFHLSPIGMVVNDTDGRFQQANEAFLHILGYTQEEVRKRGYQDFIPEDRRDEIELERTRLDTLGRYGPLQTEYLHRDGHRVSVLAQGIYIEARAGERQVVSIIQDITERLRNEEQMKRALEEADAANRAKSEFLATMSHEIRTPMNGVVGMTGLLLESELSSQQRDYVETIQQSGDSLLSIISDILDFSKIEAGRMDFQEEPFSLRDCIEGTLELLGPRAAEKGLRMAYLLQNRVPDSFIGDATRVRQVLFNLVGNAVKFTDDGEICIKVSGERSEGMTYAMHIEVVDTGIGISEEQMSRLFKSFSQVDTSSTRRHGGTGLGLVISQKLIERMGGKIWVESLPERGSTFHVVLPMTTIDASIMEQLASLTFPFKEKHAVLLESHPLSREYYRQQLTNLGMTVEAYATGHECLAGAKAMSQIDLALIGQGGDHYDEYSVALALDKIFDGGVTMVLLQPASTKLDPHLEDIFEAVLPPSYRLANFSKHLANALKVQVRDTARKSAPPLSAHENNVSEGLAILMAEDNKVNQKVTGLLLKKMGYTADIANNGLEVLDAMKRKHYDVILMDMHMPEMDGLEATRAVRSDFPKNDQPYIIALTASAFQDFKQECHEAGVNAFLTKPLRSDELEKHLRRVSAEISGQATGSAQT